MEKTAILVALLQLVPRIYALSDSTYITNESYISSIITSYDILEKDLIFGQSSFRRTIFSHALCDKMQQFEKKAKVNCTLVIKTADFNIAENSMMCNVNIQTKRKNTWISKYKELILFRENKVLLRFAEVGDSSETFLRFLTVDFPECEQREVEVEARIYNRLSELFLDQSSVSTYPDGSFDIVFLNSDHCKDFWCKSSFDDEGRRISGPTAWVPIVNPDLPKVKFQSVAIDSPDKGYIFDQYGSKLSVISPKGNQSLLNSTSHIIESLWTIDSGLISHCSSWSSRIDSVDCWQFDLKTKQKLLEANISWNDKRAKSFAVLGLRNGTVLVVSVFENKYWNLNGLTESYNHYANVTKVNSNGSKDSSRLIPTVKLLPTKDDAFRIYVKIFKRDHEDKKYCMSVVFETVNKLIYEVGCLPNVYL